MHTTPTHAPCLLFSRDPRVSPPDGPAALASEDKPSQAAAQTKACFVSTADETRICEDSEKMSVGNLRASAKLHGMTDAAPRCCGDSGDFSPDGGDSEQFSSPRPPFSPLSRLPVSAPVGTSHDPATAAESSPGGGAAEEETRAEKEKRSEGVAGFDPTGGRHLAGESEGPSVGSGEGESGAASESEVKSGEAGLRAFPASSSRERHWPQKEKREDALADGASSGCGSREMPNTASQSQGLSGFFAALLGGKEADGAAGPPPRPCGAPGSPCFSPPGEGEVETAIHDTAVARAGTNASSSAFPPPRGCMGQDGEARDEEVEGESAAKNGGRDRGEQSAAESRSTRASEDSLEARDTRELEEAETAQLLREHGGKMGAVVLGDSDEELCLFRLWGPHVAQCWVQLNLPKKGDSPRRFEMQNEGKAFWGTVLRGVPLGTPYEFVIHSNWNDCFAQEGHELHRRDPYARQTDFFSNTCYVTDASRFPWTHLQTYNAPTWNKLIIYELHPGTFSPAVAGRTVFETLMDKLDYIQSLNFNAIEFMPVQEFGGEWGYNPRLLLSIHGKYGTPDQLRRLVDKCHEKGVAVIFDLVLNHGSSKLNSLWNWDGYGKDSSGGIYFEGGGDSGWGRKFSFHKREVRDMIIAAAFCFVEEFGADGLRLDSVHNMPWDLLQELTHAVRSKHPSKILIAEVTPENPQICNGAGFDSCWIHSTYYDAVKVTRGQDGNHHVDMLRAMIDIHRHDQAGNKQGGHTDGRAGRYFVNLFGGRNNWHSRAQCRMWYSLQAVSRGLPMMFMGTETHQDGWWDCAESHRMNWGLVDGQDSHAQEMMKLVAAANKLRLSFPSLTDDDSLVRFPHLDYQNRVLGFVRGSLLIVLNCSESQWENRDYEVLTECANRSFKEIFNSQSAEFGGWEGSWSSRDRNLVSSAQARLAVNLPKWSVTVYELQA
ncbi:putative 1,4-alpha-glucan branching enzyme [Neospora caninum Liverpool]|uniref:1,4-alpha-glucan branching enzyme n=1 Tax=Neospora caninum (strain Liverpool) TaxID=572307 RepID=F0VQC4_NEOCL|nr:putative 1,4-alpha-glucan branching enzyme [Neospora caninum Liverpool]CBZ55921.1 putative 1,4-alpha-glucan branching enzyme [Neospora caninum Liverpool]|eukprot:XP_003885947.1 putative 1,4-alpha-glucan branching enzyme [Neospora caninum Liverpool]